MSTKQPNQTTEVLDKTKNESLTSDMNEPKPANEKPATTTIIDHFLHILNFYHVEITEIAFTLGVPSVYLLLWLIRAFGVWYQTVSLPPTFTFTVALITDMNILRAPSPEHHQWLVDSLLRSREIGSRILIYV